MSEQVRDIRGFLTSSATHSVIFSFDTALIDVGMDMDMTLTSRVSLADTRRTMYEDNVTFALAFDKIRAPRIATGELPAQTLEEVACRGRHYESVDQILPEMRPGEAFHSEHFCKLVSHYNLHLKGLQRWQL